MNDGASALATDPTATDAFESSRRRRSGKRPPNCASATATATATGAPNIRSCPATAVETCRSCAIETRIGASTRIAAWLVNTLMNRTTEGEAATPERDMRPVTVGAATLIY
jgi:hypothetical protein